VRRGSSIPFRYYARVYDAEQMIGEEYDLDGFGRIVQIHITVGVRVFVGANCASEEFHAGDLFPTLRFRIGERAFVRCEGLARPDSKRTIVPDADAPTITRLFEAFATGQYSLKALSAKARVEGWTIRGRRLHKSTLHQILRKRIYSGYSLGGE
jgi:hypothetical protein